jgi:hypothetical protein
MNTSSDSDQQNKEICCSDYRFVYMGVKGVILVVMKSSSCNEFQFQMILHFIYKDMNNATVIFYFHLFWQDLGLLYMLMFSGRTAGQQMSVERRDGFF